MFTGIIEEIGTIQQTSIKENLSCLTIQAKKVLEETKIGDSIAVNGVCLTVLEITPENFTAVLMPETLKVSNFQQIHKNDPVNLERAMKISDRLGGHIVSGHIDHIGEIKSILRSDRSVLIAIQTHRHFFRYLVEKGSVAIDGVSLTVIDFEQDSFQVSVLPHTLAKTTLGIRKRGDSVNLEGDILAKYALNWMHQISQEPQTKLTVNFLEEHGYI
jgi:riboflavin synthase